MVSKLKVIVGTSALMECGRFPWISCSRCLHAKLGTQSCLAREMAYRCFDTRMAPEVIIMIVFLMPDLRTLARYRDMALPANKWLNHTFNATIARSIRKRARHLHKLGFASLVGDLETPCKGNPYR